jgi:transcriptional accessory protein Tex/SPT6
MNNLIGFRSIRSGRVFEVRTRGYLRELEDRRATVLKTIGEQGQLTPELVRSIDGAQTKVERISS